MADLTSLVSEHHADMYRYAYRLAGSQADAEDLTQQAFLVAQTNLHQLRDANSARGWLFTILRNTYLKSCRKKAPVSAAALDMNMDHVPEEEAAGHEIDPEELQQALNELPAEFRIVLIMFYFEERSYREMAELLDAPLGTVMSRLSRGKRHLRAKLTANSNQRLAESRVGDPASQQAAEITLGGQTSWGVKDRQAHER